VHNFQTPKPVGFFSSEEAREAVSPQKNRMRK